MTKSAKNTEQEGTGVTPAQIDKWKKEHGSVYLIEVQKSEDEKVCCYLKKPTRAIMAAALRHANSNPLKMNETLLMNCWLAGDEEIKTDDALFLSAVGQLGELIDVKTAEIKKL